MRHITSLALALFALNAVQAAENGAKEERQAIRPLLLKDFGRACKVRGKLTLVKGDFRVKNPEDTLQLTIISIADEKLAEPLQIDCVPFSSFDEDDLQKVVKDGPADVELVGYEKVAMGGMPKDAAKVAPKWPVPAMKGWEIRHFFVVMMINGKK